MVDAMALQKLKDLRRDLAGLGSDIISTLPPPRLACGRASAGPPEAFSTAASPSASAPAAAMNFRRFMFPPSLV